MFQNVPWLSLLILLPLLGALVLLSMRGSVRQVSFNARRVALWTTGVTFLVSLYILSNFDGADVGYQFVEQVRWLSWIRVTYALGVDGISLPFILLTTFLTISAILISWESIQENVREYMACFLFLESMIIGMFCATDVLLFYIFFEAILIPMFLIIGIWGGERRVYSTFKFFFYTLTGSVFLLVAILYMYGETGTFEMLQLFAYHFSPETQHILWLAFFASFAVKLPLWPFHTWLPDAHVEAPTAGSVMLAGVLLKAGGYGFIRLSIPLFPDASVFFAPLMLTLSVIAIIYASCVALVQKDIKKLIAYSSVAHMGFVTLGLFSFTIDGVTGAMFQMISHGLISGGLFLCIGMIYERVHTRDMALLGGLVQRMPQYAFCVMILILGSIGLPGTSGFIGEFMSLIGIFQVNPVCGLLASTGIVLGATYGLWFYRKAILGQPSTLSPTALYDLKPREILILAPIIGLVIFGGIYPKPFLNMITPSVKECVSIGQSKQNKPLSRVISLKGTTDHGL
jgi:NADH-quinone oxidoreductase subunit M